MTAGLTGCIREEKLQPLETGREYIGRRAIMLTIKHWALERRFSHKQVIA